MQAKEEAEEVGLRTRRKYEELFKSQASVSDKPKPVPESPKSPSRSRHAFKPSNNEILVDREIRKLECEISELEHKSIDQLNYELKRLKEENLRFKSVALPTPIPQHQIYLVLIIGFLFAVLAHISYKL